MPMEKEPDKQFIFPISFQDYIQYQQKKQQEIKSSYNLHELHKIRKLKKILQETENKVHNRIKLYKKVSDQIHKRKEKENTQIMKREQIKSQKIQPYTIIQSKNPKNIKSRIYQGSNLNQSNHKKIQQHHNNFCRTSNEESIRCLTNQSIAQNKFDQKKAQANDIKIQKEKHKILIEQMKKQQMRRKLQSAETVRRNRYRVKQIKNQITKQRMDQARKQKQEKFKKQIEQYDQLQTKLARLQQQQREALQKWKKVVQQ